MAGEEDKKIKKKKSKKTSAAEEAPPAPAAEPEPEPVQEAAPGAEGVWPPAEGEGVWPPAAGDDEPPPVDEPVQAAEEEGGFDFSGVEEAPPQEEEGELPPQPKKKPKFFVHWDRRKAKFYDYNFDYGTNYYSSMVGYVDNKNAAFSTNALTPVPRRMAFAERGMYSSLQRSRTPDARTQSLLSDVRSSIRNFEHSQKLYAYGKRH